MTTIDECERCATSPPVEEHSQRISYARLPHPSTLESPLRGLRLGVGWALALAVRCDRDSEATVSLDGHVGVCVCGDSVLA